MATSNRWRSLGCLLGIVIVLSGTRGEAETRIASDEVAEAAKHPDVAAALAARGQMKAAFAAQDADAVAKIFSDDLIVNTPPNRVARLAIVLTLFRDRSHGL